MTVDTFILSRREITLMVGLVANVDPDEYSDAEVKAVIYRARALKERALTDGAVNVRMSR